MALKQFLHRHAKKAGLVSFVVLMAASAAMASEKKPAIKNETLNAKEVPVVVTARSLFADNKKKTATYKKDVVVKKGDITLYAEEVVINLKKDGNAPSKAKPGDDVFQGSGKIDTIVAKGNVKIVQQDKTATSEEATYYSASDKFVMTGKPRVWQGDNVLTGTKISYYVKDDTFQAEEAKTVLYQQGETAAGGAQGEAPAKAEHASTKPAAGPKASMDLRPPKASKGIRIP